MRMGAGGMASVRIGVRDVGKINAPARSFLWVQFFMIKGYVKGARNVKPFLRVESTCSADTKKHRRQVGFPSWLNWLDFG
jgi:hypothetical protein